MIVGRIRWGWHAEDDDVRAIYDESYVSSDHPECVAAFLEKPAPDFT